MVLVESLMVSRAGRMEVGVVRKERRVGRR